MPDPASTRPGPAVAALRSATAADHQQVDQRFGGFDLTSAAGYSRFLTAHALALPGVERALAGQSGLPVLRPRASLIATDLAGLDQPLPTPLPCALPESPAAAFGMAYVIEGSRLGGALIARSLPAELPSAYLSEAHYPGEWRNFLLSLEAAATDDAWIGDAIAAARATFARYAQAADAV